MLFSKFCELIYLTLRIHDTIGLSYSLFQYSIFTNSIVRFLILFSKRPVKLIQPEKITHSFLHPLLNLFHFIISSIAMYMWLSKNFSLNMEKYGVSIGLDL